MVVTDFQTSSTSEQKFDTGTHRNSERSNRKNGTSWEKNGVGQELTLDTVNPLLKPFKAMEYASRGPVILRAMEIEKELKSGVEKPFDRVIKVNLGDAHAMGQKPITFLRQVLAIVSYPSLLNSPEFPSDVKARATTILNSFRGNSAGAYTESRGIAVIREHVADYIRKRDGGIPSSPENIILCSGASEGIRACLKLLKNGNSGVMIPVPEYPLYSASLGEFDIRQVPYLLSEKDCWTIETKELVEAAAKAAKDDVVVRGIVVINPGNPTGHVLSQEAMQEIIKFAYSRKIVILADEVYQDNICDGNEFFSFKRVLSQMPSPYNQTQLISFYSCSKGYICECGIRGGYFEMVNLDPDVMSILVAAVAAKLCPSALGQTTVDCAVKPPVPGDPSYPLFEKEKQEILKSLKARGKLSSKLYNSLPHMKCAEMQGAMYVFPEIVMPLKAIQAAEKAGQEPDLFYALQLLEATGICVVPGCGIGQREGTYHFRTTVLPDTETLHEMSTKFAEFHINFIQQYA